MKSNLIIFSRTVHFLLSYSVIVVFLFNCCQPVLNAATKSKHRSVSVPPSSVAEKEKAALKYFAELEGRYSTACNRNMMLRWDFVTNITDETEEALNDADVEFGELQVKINKELLSRFPKWKDFKNKAIKREFKYLLSSGPGNLKPSEVAKMNKIQSEMESDYATAVVCQYENKTNCNMKLDPDIFSILGSTRDPKVLAYYWTARHDKLSELVPPSKYAEYISLKDAKAKGNGFKDTFRRWMDSYNDESPGFSADKFRKKMLGMWEEIRPMYEKVHAYVRMKLREQEEYKGLIGKCGHIPIYATGNLWAQEWASLDAITKPYPDIPSLDASEAMRKKNYTVLKMFKTADTFFTELGLPPMTPTFWQKSMFKRPRDGRRVLCHPMAYDFCSGKGNQDFRVKQCARVNHYNLVEVHHEMGHVAYYQQYTNLSYAFRDGANPGFHEAIGDALALSVVTPKHLHCKLGLDLGGLGPKMCEDNQADADSAPTSYPISKADINFLYYMALAKFVSIPFAISVDTWRWEVFEGYVKPEDYNKRWWEIRMKNQGVEPPTNRMKPNLFDPAGIYHIVADIEYFRYFVSSILHFQFYEAMCIAAGQFDPKNSKSKPLYQCDISGSKEAGRALGNMMKLGMSKPWPVALETLTGSRTMSISPLKHYFQPLLDHIGKELEANGELPGFGGNGKCK